MARQSKGRIFTRGKQKRFYLQYYVNGKQFAVALKDADGNPITDPKAAKYAAADILNPVNAANKADQLKKIRAAVEDAETKAERLAEAEAMRRQNDAERAAEILQPGQSMTAADFRRAITREMGVTSTTKRENIIDFCIGRGFVTEREPTKEEKTLPGVRKMIERPAEPPEQPEFF